MAPEMFPWIPSTLLFFVLVIFSGETSAQSANQTTGSSIYSSTTPSIVSSTPEESSTSTVPPKPLPRNTDVGPCPCDLTVKGCDVNCCCDSDCSAADRTTFTECITFNSIVDDRLCFQENIFYAVNSKLVSNKSSSGIFCIYYDNYPSRNFYKNPDLITNTSAFEEYVHKYSAPSFQRLPQNSTEFAKFYKSGDPIGIIYGNDTLGFLRLPRSMTSEYCADFNPATYLFDQKFSCVRNIPNLQTECERIPSIKASTYFQNFRIISSPGIFENLNVTFENISTDTILALYNSNLTLSFANVTLCKDINCRPLANINTTDLLPRYDMKQNTCYNVVEKVFYEITCDGTSGITSLNVKLHLIDLNKINIRLTQTFATEFKRSQSNGVSQFRRSGNPGYVISEPIMAGTLKQLIVDQKTVLMIKMSTDRNNWLTLPQSTASGDCSSTTRVPVTFGQDLRTGCFIRVSDDDVRSMCEQLQNRTTNILLGNSIYTHVASFGNILVTDVGDWLRILGLNKQPEILPFDDGYCSLSLGLQIQVMFAQVGSISNPQSKIIGVAYNFEQRRNIYPRCPGISCQINSDHLLEVVASVTFHDASQPVVEVIAKPPIYQLYLPFDFFYPFVSNMAPERHSPSKTVRIFVISVIVSVLAIVS